MSNYPPLPPDLEDSKVWYNPTENTMWACTFWTKRKEWWLFKLGPDRNWRSIRKATKEDIAKVNSVLIKILGAQIQKED